MWPGISDVCTPEAEPEELTEDSGGEDRGAGDNENAAKYDQV